MGKNFSQRLVTSPWFAVAKLTTKVDTGRVNYVGTVLRPRRLGTVRLVKAAR